jgi:hypothetical protein
MGAGADRYKMTDDDWDRAHKIASELVQKGTDVNELAKVFTYLRTRLAKPDAINDFWLLLARLPKARAFVRSGRTLDYYRSIQECCVTNLKGLNEVHRIVGILGWAVRLGRFYWLKPPEPSSGRASDLVKGRDQHPQGRRVEGDKAATLSDLLNKYGKQKGQKKGEKNS